MSSFIVWKFYDNKSVLQPSWPCYFNRNLIIVVSSQKCIDKVRQFHWHMSYKPPAGNSFQIHPDCIFIMLFGFFAIILVAVSLPKLESTQIYKNDDLV